MATFSKTTWLRLSRSRGIAAKTKALVREIPPATQANNGQDYRPARTPIICTPFTLIENAQQRLPLYDFYVYSLSGFSVQRQKFNATSSFCGLEFSKSLKRNVQDFCKRTL